MMKRISVLLATALLLLAACGDDNGDAQNETADEQTDDRPVEGQTVDVTGREYAFKGVPPTLEPGPATFTFENVGKQPHEMVIFKVKTDKPIEKLLKLPRQKAQRFVEQVGGTGAAPGNKAAQPVEAELTEGSYAMICFVPAPDKTPHFAKGMVASFTVGG